MRNTDWTLKAILTSIALLLGIIAFRPVVSPDRTVMAQAARFDHVFIVSVAFLYKGHQGLLVLDRRNANVWFFPRVNDQYQSPILVEKLPFDKLDQAAR